MTRRRWVAAVAAGSVLLAVAGFAAAQVVKSPAQAAADTKPPAADVLTAPVERRVLKETVVLRGTVAAGESVTVTPVSPGGEGAAEPVVTKLPLEAGETIRAGQVLVEVSGRPVFVLQGRLPVYRDLKPGAEGDDVAQLQKALRDLGHSTGSDASGTFGAGTKAALQAFYAQLGYEPRPAVDDDGEATKAAEQGVRSAERALEQARSAADAASAAPAGAAPTAESTTGTGGDARGGDGGGASGGDGGGASGGDGGDASDGDGGDAGGAAADRAADGRDRGAAEARRAVEWAREDLETARQVLADARAAAGPMLPAGEVVFLPGFPARVDSVSATVGARVTTGVMTVSAGKLVVQGYLQERQKGLVRAGQPVEILAERSGKTVRGKVRSVSETLDEGQDREGAPADGTDGERAPAAARGYPVVVEPDKPLDRTWAGQEVRLTVEAGSTEGKALVVPVTAVSVGSDGKSAVTVVAADGTQRRVRVRAGTQGDGYVEVVPVGSDRLAPGALVVTGIRRSAASGGGGA
ncbi:peptidoglycan-binding protein [Streptomyces coelicoflavus]|uniref:Peptidoglycan-binding protein n=2 Tax=Streptomyces coelicoflavus TaxID=285562 RepID=A0A7K3PNP1_9ACTN|nr:peptidoglycan-binding protein [Streptomyces coelicoflavus]NEB11467.1 peptidoglycan-binding protein [Streptomyces coelicoflavus]